MNLNVGCGPTHIKGVNLDIKGPCDVRGSVFFLPFRSASFRVVYASHLLEHLKDPLSALKELRRVAAVLVAIKVPNSGKIAFSEHEEHLFSWNCHSLENFLKLVFPHVTLSYSNRYRGFNPLAKIKNVLLTALQPNELTAICRLSPH